MCLNVKQKENISILFCFVHFLIILSLCFLLFFSLSFFKVVKRFSNFSSHHSEFTKTKLPIWNRQCDNQICGNDHSLFYIFNSLSLFEFASQLRRENPLLATCLVLTFSLVLGAIIVALSAIFRKDGQHLREQDPLERSYLSSSIRHVLLRTFSDSHLRLLLPMAFFIGLSQAFFIADFQKVTTFFFHLPTQIFFFFLCYFSFQHHFCSSSFTFVFSFLAPILHLFIYSCFYATISLFLSQFNSFSSKLDGFILQVNI